MLNTISECTFLVLNPCAGTFPISPPSRFRRALNIAASRCVRETIYSRFLHISFTPRFQFMDVRAVWAYAAGVYESILKIRVSSNQLGPEELCVADGLEDGDVHAVRAGGEVGEGVRVQVEGPRCWRWRRHCCDCVEWWGYLVGMDGQLLILGVEVLAGTEWSLVTCVG